MFTPAELAGVLVSTSVCFDLSIFELFVTAHAWRHSRSWRRTRWSCRSLAARERVTLINTVPSAMTELVQREWRAGVSAEGESGGRGAGAGTGRGVSSACRSSGAAVEPVRADGGHDLLDVGG